MLWAAAGSMVVWSRYRVSRDRNPIPWAYLTVVLAVYAVAVFVIIVGSRLVLQDWWRPMFSVLNMSVIAGAAWVITRAVRHG